MATSGPKPAINRVILSRIGETWELFCRRGINLCLSARRYLSQRCKTFQRVHTRTRTLAMGVGWVHCDL